MNLYEISKEIQNLSQMVDEDGCILEEAIDQLNSLEIEKTQKLKNIAGLIYNLEAEAEAFKAEKNRLQMKEKVATAKADRLRKWIQFVMEGQNIKLIQAGIFEFTLKTTKSIQVDDVNSLPDEYKKITVEAKKTLLKEAMKLGTTFPGVWIKESPCLTIR